MSLARIRQLAAHETGHTLGFAHNFAASTYGRASVMDYPAPWVEIKDGKLDLSNAYATGIGAFDKFAVEVRLLAVPARRQRGAASSSRSSKTASRTACSTSPTPTRVRPAPRIRSASLWDNGSDPIATLEARDGGAPHRPVDSSASTTIPVGTPLSELERQAAAALPAPPLPAAVAAAKSLGGVYFTYAVRTAGGPESRRRWPKSSRRARRRRRSTPCSTRCRSTTLRIPERILDLIPPTAFGYGGGTAETFDTRTDPTFDPIGAAAIAADLAISGAAPARSARPASMQQRRATRAVPASARWSRARGARRGGAPMPADGYGRAIQREVAEPDACSG